MTVMPPLALVAPGFLRFFSELERSLPELYRTVTVAMAATCYLEAFPNSGLPEVTMPPHLRHCLVCPLLLLLSLPALALQPGLAPPAPSLPPGLQKAAPGGSDAQGWTLEPPPEAGDSLPDHLYRGGYVLDLDDHHQRVAVEDRIYIVLRDTRKILRVVDR